MVWVLPEERGVITMRDARAPRRLLKLTKTDPFEIRINSAFGAVIAACAAATPVRPDTWINDAIVEAYTELHYRGIAHSVECWREGRLVGGLYGLVLGAAFCGESMFSREANASKVAMVHLMARLKAGGFHFVDAQFYNEHLEQFGLIGVPNEDYQAMLKASLAQEANFPRLGGSILDGAGGAVDHPYVVDRMLQSVKRRAGSKHPAAEYIFTFRLRTIQHLRRGQRWHRLGQNWRRLDWRFLFKCGFLRFRTERRNLL